MKEITGGAGEARTPDLRFRKCTVLLHLLSFQLVTFGVFRALSGMVGRLSCNAICNGNVAQTWCMEGNMENELVTNDKGVADRGASRLPLRDSWLWRGMKMLAVSFR
jgi:hypothetical protein